MVDIKFIEANGQVHAIEAESGISLMRAALENGVPGIDGDCGGLCACGTCHVYIADDWQERAGTRSEMEEEMLHLADDVRQTSRLACQIEVDERLHGLTVNLPVAQH